LQTYKDAKLNEEPSVDLSLSQMCDGDGYLDAINDGSVVVRFLVVVHGNTMNFIFR
jgi:hypothetical protein